MGIHETEPHNVSLKSLEEARDAFMSVCMTTYTGLVSLDREQLSSGTLAGELELQFPSRMGLMLSRSDGKAEMAASMGNDRREGTTYRVGDKLFDSENPLFINKVVAAFALNNTLTFRFETEPEHTISSEVKVEFNDIWRYSYLPFNLTLPADHTA